MGNATDFDKTFYRTLSNLVDNNLSQEKAHT